MKKYENLPMSLRTKKGERAYQLAKVTGGTIPLQEEESIYEFKHWRVIDNRFPYDSAYLICEMLIPKRVVPSYSDLRWYERRELRKIIDKYCANLHSQVVENMTPTRSVHNIYHLHLLKFRSDRKDFKL